MRITHLALMPLIILFSNTCFCQLQPIVVTEQTLKISAQKEEKMYFGFEQGDQVIFDFSEVNGKELKEIEIIEYPSSSKYSQFETANIKNKMINVSKRSIYEFRFQNTALGGRICNIKIQRIPINESTINFNTNVLSKTLQDTIWNTYTKDILVGYDTTYLQKSKKELVSSEKKEELIIDKTEIVHSNTNANGNLSTLAFSLPKNSVTPYKQVKVIAWAYWVGVGDEANEAWKQNMQTVANLTKGIASYYTTPLGGLAVGALTELLIPKIGENVHYGITDLNNKNLFVARQPYKAYDSGDGVAGYRKFLDAGMQQGNFFVCLSNDNNFEGIPVNVKVIAIVQTDIYEDKTYTEMKVTARYEKKLFTDPSVKTSTILVNE